MHGKVFRSQVPGMTLLHRPYAVGRGQYAVGSWVLIHIRGGMAVRQNNRPLHTGYLKPSKLLEFFRLC